MELEDRRSRIAALTMALAAATALAGPAALDRLRTPDNPRPLPSEYGAPPNHSRWSARRGEAGEELCGAVRNDFLCNDDTASGCRQLAPKIAVDAGGNFVVSWYEFRDGDADAWFQRLDSAGNRIGVNQRLNTDITMGWQGDPSSAMGPGRSFLFCWEDRREIGNSDLFAQRFDPAGGRLADNFRVSDSAAAGDQSMSGAWIAQNGVALLAWDDRRYGLTGDIFAQFLGPDGSPMGTNFRVNDDPVGLANQYEPEVSGDTSGRFVVTWMDGRGNNAYDWNVFCQRLNSLGQRLDTNIQVTTDDSIQQSPDVSCGVGGEFVVTWDDRRNGNWDVYGQRYDGGGSPVGQNFKVNDDVGSSDQFGSGVAVNRYGEFVVVWTDDRGGEDGVYARRYDASGSPLGPSFRLGDVSAGAQLNPSIEPRPDGGYWAAWADARSGDPDIYCQHLDRSGSKVGPNFRINDDHGSAIQRCSSIGMDVSGSILLAWEDERNGTSDIYRCVIDPTGNLVGANLRLNDDGPGGADQFYASVAGGNGRFIAAWTDARSGSTDIYAQYMDSAGAAAGPNFLVNSDGSSASQWYPYAAMDSGNNAAVVWMDSRSGTYQMYCRRYRPDGAPLGPEIAVQDSTGAGYYGSVAMNRSGRFSAAWMDYRSGTPDIYCQAYWADGSPIGGNVRVNSDPGGKYHGYPSSAIAEQGRFVVAWEDMRNDAYDVYVQWFDSTGARIGGNEQVNDNPTAAAAYSPSCAFAPDGRLAVVFSDEREFPGNPQIYCQRYRPDGTRIGNNRKVNAANLFPNNHHWTVGQSIAASDAGLAFAWADNRRHRGFDIYAKLTDWNLSGVSEVPTEVSPFGVLPTIVGRHGHLGIGLQSPGGGAALYDAVGRQVRRVSSADRELDLSGISPGAYFLVVRGGAQAKCRKIVIE